MLAMPVFGQVQGDMAAAVPDSSGGGRDQVAADRRGPGLRERQGRQGAVGAEEMTSSQAATSCQPGPSADSRPARRSGLTSPGPVSTPDGRNSHPEPMPRATNPDKPPDR